MEANDMKAMREALAAINCIDTRRLKSPLYELVEADIFDGGLINKTIAAIEKATRALAVPPRNCDVGTAEEQAVRFRTFCASHFDKVNRCGDCPAKYYIDGWGSPYCQLKWAQMPYTESEAAQ